MNKRLVTPLLLVLMSVSAPSGAFAASLDEPSIRQLYAKADAAVGKREQTRLAMEERLDEKFILTSSLSQVIGDAPPVYTEARFGKRQVIDNAMRGYTVMAVDHYLKTITSITFSEDLRFAFVGSQTASSGQITVGGEAVPKPSRYEDGESCIDQLTLIKDSIKIIKSSCNERFVVKDQTLNLK